MSRRFLFYLTDICSLNTVFFTKLNITEPILAGEVVLARTQMIADAAIVEDIADTRQTVGVDKAVKTERAVVIARGYAREIFVFGAGPEILYGTRYVHGVRGVGGQ